MSSPLPQSLAPPAERDPSTPRGTPRSGERRRVIIYSVLLFLVAVAWRLPLALMVQRFRLDEIRYSWPTVYEFLAGHWPIYPYGSAYMAPVQEACSAILYNFWGPSILTLRLPTVLFYAASCVISFFVLRNLVSTRAAFALGLLLACENSVGVTYPTFSIPDWGVGLALIALLQLLTFWVARNRSLFRYAVFGIIAGITAYVFKLSEVQTGISILWLFLTSPPFSRFVESCHAEGRMRERARLLLPLAAVACLTGLPVLYHYLTRRSEFKIRPIEIAASCLSAAAACLAALWLARLVRFPLRAWCGAACFLALFAATNLPETVYFSRVVKPRLVRDGQLLWDCSRYDLKQFHEWPLQPKLLVDRVFPAAIVGRASQLQGNNITALPMEPRGVVTTLILLLFTALGIRRLRLLTHWTRSYQSRDFVCVIPLFAVLALMLPSWDLVDDWSVRFLVPFYSGLFLMIYRMFQPFMSKIPTVWFALVTGYILYCGVDCLLYFR